METIMERFGGQDGRRLPDVVYVYDDYVTRGALTAFAHLGVCIPEDVGFVGFANRGFAPCTTCSLACFRCDPRADAQTVAKAALRHLSGGQSRASSLYGPVYVPGGTFAMPEARRRARPVENPGTGKGKGMK